MRLRRATPDARTAGQDGTMSRNVPLGVAEGGAGHTLGVSCPVPLSRPSVPVVLAIAALHHGEPNELDAIHLAAAHHAAGN